MSLHLLSPTDRWTRVENKGKTYLKRENKMPMGSKNKDEIWVNRETRWSSHTSGPSPQVCFLNSNTTFQWRLLGLSLDSKVLQVSFICKTWQSKFQSDLWMRCMFPEIVLPSHMHEVVQFGTMTRKRVLVEINQFCKEFPQFF